VSERKLIEVDGKIAKLRDDIANGRASEIAQVELTELVQKRQELIKAIAEPWRDVP
jgi:hypothetical protein